MVTANTVFRRMTAPSGELDRYMLKENILMGVDEKISDLVISMIMCHENGDFNKLKTLMTDSTLEAKDSFFTQEKFNEVSQKIHEQLGNFIKVEYLGFLTKTNSIHTLWKANYSNSNEDALWQVRINADHRDPKIIRMSIN